MAAYVDLQDFKTNEALLDKVEVACWVAADTIYNESPATTNHANRLVWAKGVFENSRKEAYTLLPSLLAQNKAATVAQINGVSDANIQSAVDSAVDLFATG